MNESGNEKSHPVGKVSTDETNSSVIGQRPIQEQSWRHRSLLVAAASVVSFLIIFSHRPDALLNPQFLAEDGAYFYAQAYNLGPWRALALPIAGYLVTSARLAGLIAVFFPVSWGPAIFNTLAIVIQIAPVTLLFTNRFDHLVPNWYARVALVFLYLALPNSFELDAAMTYSQWHLALLAALVVIAAPPSNKRWRVFDGFIILLAGLSGPFCLLLAPVILLRWLRVRSPHLLTLFMINLVASAAQVITLIATGSSARAHGNLGINAVELARIIAGQLFVAATLGMRGYMLVGTLGWWATDWFPVAIAIAGAVFLGYTLRTAPQELRLLWLFSALVLAASLFSPVIPGPGTYWQRLAAPGWNLRYEYLLGIAWLSTLVWILSTRPKPALRRLTLVLLTFTCLAAIPLDWQYSPFTDYHYQSYVTRFERLPVGSRIAIPLNPGGWTMVLIKH